MYQLLRGARLEDEEIIDGVLLLRVGIVDFFLISSPLRAGEEIEKVSDYMSRSWRSCESFVGISWTCHQTSLWKISYVPANGLIFGLDG